MTPQVLNPYDICNMLEAPNLSLDELAGFVQRTYGLPVKRIDFLPLGADVNTAVFRVVAGDADYFLKLRSGIFDETSVALPAFLASHGNAHIIPILPTTAGALWSRFERYTAILYLFVEGQNGFRVKLSPAQWHDFGAALKHVHTANVPANILNRIPIERYSPFARDAVDATLARLNTFNTDDAITLEVVALLRNQRDVIVDLVSRAGHLAQTLPSQRQDFVVCHSDIHAGNILIDRAGHLFIVDWDNPIRAPKERDLMFFGGGQGFVGYSAPEEQALFYAGYGETPIDQNALAYYRYERIVQDIAAFCDALLSSEGDGEDRRQSLKWLASNFDAGSVIDVAYAADQST